MSSEARRLHPVAMVIGAVRTLRRWIGALAAGGAAALFGGGMPLQAVIFLGVFLVVVGSAVGGFLSWRATTYSVSGGAFHLRQGVLQKNERTIPLEHVQSVDTVQGVIQRLFRVVEVRVETAGGGGSEPDASLSALDPAAAEALRREIESSRRETFRAEDEEPSGPSVIRRLGMRDLLIAGATSGQIGVALSLVAVGSQIFDDFLSESFLERVYEVLAPESFLAFAILTLLVGLFAWLLAIGGTVLAYTGFTLSRDGEFLYIRRGLLERREATIPLARIQAIQVVEGVLRQPFGLAMLKVESAGYGEDAGVSTTLFPLLPRRETKRILSDAAPEFARDPALKLLPARARRRYMVRAALPVLVPLAVALPVLSVVDLHPSLYPFAGGPVLEARPSTATFVLFAGAVLFLTLAAAFHGWLRYRAAGWACSGDCLVMRSRLLGRTTAIVPRRRLQSRSVVRSPFQRRARLATLRARVASGGGGTEFGVVDLESASAETLLDRLGPGLSPPSQ